MARILQRRYFSRKTLRVARSLLGTFLLRRTEGQRLVGRIIEVEAYIGQEDRACHASRGRTKRTEVMFGQAGIAYVYLIYGMYHCFNIVTERAGFAAAVLIRAVEDGEGCLIDGPGRVCRAFWIDRTLNGWDVTKGRTLWLEDRTAAIPASEIDAFPRVGVAYAGTWAAKPWRFRIKGYGKGGTRARARARDGP